MNGNYDIICFFLDHKLNFPALFNIVISQLAPHITTGVDCEPLFSQAGHISKSNWNRTMSNTFERLAILNHCMSRIYYCPEKIKARIYGEVE